MVKMVVENFLMVVVHMEVLAEVLVVVVVKKRREVVVLVTTVVKNYCCYLLVPVYLLPYSAYF